MKSKILFNYAQPFTLFKKKNSNPKPNSENELEQSIKAIEEKMNQATNKILELKKQEQELLESLFKQREQELLSDYFYHKDFKEEEKDDIKGKSTCSEIKARGRKINTDDIKVEKDDIIVIENNQNTGSMNEILYLKDQQKNLSSELELLKSEKYNLKFQLTNLEAHKKPDKTCSIF